LKSLNSTGEKMITEVDLNADIGEGFGNYVMANDEPIMALITSANIACGFHAGDPVIMRNTVALAQKYGVAVGAHPGLPDLMGFGRRVMDVNPEEIYTYLVYQVGALKAFAEICGVKLHHVKPHGAFMRSTMANEDQARAMVEAFLKIDPGLILYCPGPLEFFHPTLVKVASEMGMRIVPEFYAQLNYTSKGKLVPVRMGEIKANPSAMARRVLRFFKEGKVTSTEGTELSFEASSICVHGDNPHAVEVIKAIRDTLSEAGISIKSVAK
jgi:UPF0271 protein